MSNSHTGISWTQATWNPTTGCSQVSAGCDHCYAKSLIDVRQSKNPKTQRFGKPFEEVLLHPERLRYPRSVKHQSRIFVNSMSDLFHKDIPDDYVQAVFEVMRTNPKHQFQVLTKRADRLHRYTIKYQPIPLPNVWLGVSIENMRVGWRLPWLLKSPAQIRWISAEPLLGSLNQLSLSGVDWGVAGGESGPGHRPMELEWARQLRDRCQKKKVAFFLKQLGGPINNKRAGDQALLDGRTWTEYPI
jgi:protein gp37